MNKRIKEEKKSTTAMADALAEAAAAKQARMDQQMQELEERVDGGFNAQPQLGGDDVEVMATAMQLIAGLFFDPYEKVDRQSGQVTTENSYGYWQDRALTGILYALHNGLEYSVGTTLPKAQAAAQKAQRAHKGDELSELELNRACDWVERLQSQMAFVGKVLTVAEDEYTILTGKRYAYQSRAVANRDVVPTAAMERARRLGIGVVNVDAAHNSGRGDAA